MNREHALAKFQQQFLEAEEDLRSRNFSYLGLIEFLRNQKSSLRMFPTLSQVVDLVNTLKDVPPDVQKYQAYCFQEMLLEVAEELNRHIISLEQFEYFAQHASENEEDKEALSELWLHHCLQIWLWKLGTYLDEIEMNFHINFPWQPKRGVFLNISHYAGFLSVINTIKNREVIAKEERAEARKNTEEKLQNERMTKYQKT
jgi:hypothetical protein